MVCDNLAFFGEIATGHKNTQHIMNNLPGRIDGMMSQIQDNWKAQAKRYDTYADTELSESDAGKILWDAIDIDAISGSKSAKVINEYNNPRHDAFSDRNAWSYSTCIYRDPKRISYNATATNITIAQCIRQLLRNKTRAFRIVTIITSSAC